MALRECHYFSVAADEIFCGGKSNGYMSIELIKRDLVLTRLIKAPREKVYRAWTDAEMLKQWFAPLPYTTPEAELDVRPGGSQRIVMRSPEGGDSPMLGVYLEVLPNERLVFTDAYSAAWEPTEKAFMTVVLTFEDEEGGTRYTALVRHWTAADCEAQEKMGFHAGWGAATDQLEQLLAGQGGVD